MTEADLRAERAHHDRARTALVAMHDQHSALMAGFAADFAESRRNRRPGDARPDHNAGVAMARHREARAEALRLDDVPLFFGRIRTDAGEDHHLGRRHVREGDDRSDTLVVDWRAPVGERFYRASPQDRLGVRTRRRFGFRGAELTSIEDEDLEAPSSRGSALLAEEVARPRTGPMRDIVATIQPDQDELIRREGTATLCVQGAPGTGKTAVGLHRAAWLLYTYPARLRRSGMLVVGPHEGFVDHVAEVLPMLGETTVVHATVDRLTGAGSADAVDPDKVAEVKHSAAVLEVCARAVWSHLHVPDDDLEVRFRGVDHRVPAAEIADAQRRARDAGRGWDAGRRMFETAAAAAVLRRVEQRSGRPREAGWLTDLKRDPAFRAQVGRLWPRLDARKVLRRLGSDDEFRDASCQGLLDAERAGLLARRGALRPTAADLLLLDELQSHLGPVKDLRTYGHVVVDEAQDLSPLQCRYLSRRCPSGALTVLGDLAQGTTAWAASDWRSQLQYLGRGDDAVLTELTDGYRVPEAVLALANRLLPHLGVDVPGARSVRRDGGVEQVNADDPVAATRAAVAAALAQPGTVGVVAADAVVDRLRSALPVDDRLVLVPVRWAKGLEFDHVVLVDPEGLVEAAAPGRRQVGLRHLYVALTRAVSRLTVVRTRPGPPELE